MSAVRWASADPITLALPPWEQDMTELGATTSVDVSACKVVAVFIVARTVMVMTGGLGSSIAWMTWP